MQLNGPVGIAQSVEDLRLWTSSCSDERLFSEALEFGAQLSMRISQDSRPERPVANAVYVMDDIYVIHPPAT